VSTADPQRALRLQPRELAATRVAHVYRRLHVPLSHEGWQVNHKRVYRLYRIEGLAMRKKTPRRRVACVKREDIRVVVRFGILERISIRSYVFASVGTVERPFPAKTYHYRYSTICPDEERAP